MNGSIFVFTRKLDDTGSIVQNVTIYAADRASAEHVLRDHLASAKIASRNHGAYDLARVFDTVEIALENPTLISSFFTRTA